MLCESECRILCSSFDFLYKDFEPRDAMIYLEGCGVLSEPQVDAIQVKVGYIFVKLIFFVFFLFLTAFWSNQI